MRTCMRMLMSLRFKLGKALKGLGKAGKTAGKVASGAATAVGIGGTVASMMNQPQSREFDDELVTREPVKYVTCSSS
jgi:hypothetical protein